MSASDPPPGLPDHGNDWPESLQREVLDATAGIRAEFAQRRRKRRLRIALVVVYLGTIIGGAIAVAKLAQDKPHLTSQQEAHDGRKH